MLSVTNEEGYTIEIRGQRFDLTREEGDAIRQEMHRVDAARREAAEQAARDAGQVWHAIYWRFHSKSEDEFFSLDEAVGFLSHGEGYGELSAEAITTPDGGQIEGDELFNLIYAADR